MSHVGAWALPSHVFDRLPKARLGILAVLIYVVGQDADIRFGMLALLAHVLTRHCKPLQDALSHSGSSALLISMFDRMP